jgi:hypothetical protein
MAYYPPAKRQEDLGAGAGGWGLGLALATLAAAVAAAAGPGPKLGTISCKMNPTSSPLHIHLCLEVSAIAMIDLDDYIFGSQNRFYQGIPVAVSGDVMSHVYRSH